MRGGHTAIDAGVAQVFALVNGVRRRWRWARVLRGTAMALSGVLGTLIVAALLLDRAAYSPAAVIAGRIAVAVVGGVLLVRFAVLPLLRRPRDPQVALYVEEHEPSLDGAWCPPSSFRSRGRSSRCRREGTIRWRRM